MSAHLADIIIVIIIIRNVILPRLQQHTVRHTVEKFNQNPFIFSVTNGQTQKLDVLCLVEEK